MVGHGPRIIRVRVGIERYKLGMVFRGKRPVPFLLLGIVTIGWAGFSLITGKGHYKGCPPGGYDRAEHPFNFWVPTMIILGIGVCMILIFLGFIRLPSR